MADLFLGHLVVHLRGIGIGSAQRVGKGPVNAIVWFECAERRPPTKERLLLILASSLFEDAHFAVEKFEPGDLGDQF